ncbi:PSME3-interacting protein isoform X1 [Tachysurus ichikawai]
MTWKYLPAVCFSDEENQQHPFNIRHASAEQFGGRVVVATEPFGRHAAVSQALKKMVSSQSQKKEPEKKAAPKPPEQKTSHLSQAHLLAGAVKRRSSSQSSESGKKQKVEETTTTAAETTGNGSQTDQETVGQKSVPSSGVTRGGTLHRPSAAMCVGILPGLGAYSGSSDSESSSDSEGSVEGTTFPIKCHRLFR